MWLILEPYISEYAILYPQSRYTNPSSHRKYGHFSVYSFTTELFSKCNNTLMLTLTTKSTTSPMHNISVFTQIYNPGSSSVH